MRKNILPVLLVFSFLVILFPSYKMHGQVISNYLRFDGYDYKLIPFQQEKLLGYVDRANNIVIQPNYEAVSWFDKTGIAQVKKFGLFGLIDQTGKEIVPPISRFEIGQTVARIIKKNEEQPLNNIIAISNSSNKKLIYYNRTKKIVSKEYKASDPPFEDRVGFSSTLNIENHYFVNSYKKVGKENGTVNFIDTLFQEVFKSDIVNGKALSENEFVIYDAQGKGMLYKKDGTLISNKAYFKINESGLANYFIVEVQGINNYNTKKGIINNKGELIIDTLYSEINYLHKDIFKVSKDYKSGALDIKNKFIFPIEFDDLKAYNQELYFVASKGTFKILDIKENQVSGPYPSSFSKFENAQKGYIVSKDTFILLSETGKELFRKAGKFQFSKYNDHYVVLRQDNMQFLYDYNGQLALDQPINNIELTHIDDVVIITNTQTNENGVYSKSKGWLYPMSKKLIVQYANKSYNNGDDVITVKAEKEVITYKNKWENKTTAPRFDFTSQQYETTTIENKRYIITSDGTMHEMIKEKGFQPIVHENTVYYRTTHMGMTDIVNEQKKSIIPVGFKVREIIQMDKMFFVEVYNDQQKTGLIDNTGKFVINAEPLQNIKLYNSSIWSIYTNGKSRLMHFNFKLLSEKYYKQISVLDNRHLLAMAEASGKIDVYENSGKLISSGKYESIIKNNQGFYCGKKLNNALESCTLDSLMNEVKCYPYEEVFELKDNKEYLLAKDLYDAGVIKSNGEVFIPFHCKEIIYHDAIKMFQVIKANYLNDFINLKGEKIIENFSGYLNPNKISNTTLAFDGEKQILILSEAAKPLYFDRKDNYLNSNNKEQAEQGICFLGNNNYTLFVDFKKGIKYNGVK